MHKPGDEKRMVVILDREDYLPWLTCGVLEAPRFSGRGRARCWASRRRWCARPRPAEPPARDEILPPKPPKPAHRPRRHRRRRASLF